MQDLARWSQERLPLVSILPHITVGMILESGDIVLTTVKPTSIRIIGWADILIFLSFALVSWRQGAELWVSIGFILFVCLGLYLLIWQRNPLAKESGLFARG